MYEFTIMYKATGEGDILYGYTEQDALRRAGVAREDVTLLLVDYID